MNQFLPYFIILATLFFAACSTESETPEEVLELYLTSISDGDCERARELSIEDAKEDAQYLIEDGCQGNNNEILSIKRVEINNDSSCTCIVRYTRETEYLDLSYGKYTFNSTYSLKKENDQWKVRCKWKEMGWPEEIMEPYHDGE